MMAIHNEWDPACKVWIGNLGNEGTKLEIEDAFSEIGTVKNIWLAKNPPGFAFVEMDVSKTCHFFKLNIYLKCRTKYAICQFYMQGVKNY
jgi:hypothetical protein